jgi:thioesterase domain-containing protein
MAAHYLEAIRAAQPSGPYYLAGFCFGGMVAFEMARLLAAQGQIVALLALFNTPAPDSLREAPLSPHYLQRRIRYELNQLVSVGIWPKLRIASVKSVGLARRTWGYYKAALWGVFERSSTPGVKAWRLGLLSVSDANIAAAKVYLPGTYAGQITLFSTLEVAPLWAIDPQEGWLPFAVGGVEHHTIEGDHQSLFDAPFVTTLSEKLARCIEGARARLASQDAREKEGRHVSDFSRPARQPA